FGAFTVDRTAATPATWDVRAGVSDHFFPGNLYVGSNSSFNRLLITNGAVLTNVSGAIGVQMGANSNLALISGAGSAWSMADNLILGTFGSANQLVVSNGAIVLSGGEIGQSVIGDQMGKDNTATVTGAGSVWRNASGLYLGFSGAGSRLLIS